LGNVNGNKIDSKAFGSVRNNKGERKALVDTMAEMGGQTERLDQEEEDVRCPLIHPRRPTGMACMAPAPMTCSAMNLPGA
jgi:hypothetical protein